MRYLSPLSALALCLALSLGSCKYRLSYDKEGMQQLHKELTHKFGSDAWYSEITVLNPSEEETLIRVKTTDDPNSLRGKSWVKQAGSWIPLEDVVFQFSDSQPQSHLFQLGRQASLDTLAQLIKRSATTLRQQGIDSATVHFVSIQSAQMVKQEDKRILYNISFRNHADGQSYTFVYDLRGRLLMLNR